MGVNLANDDQLRALAEQVNAAATADWRAAPLVPGANVSGAEHRRDQSRPIAAKPSASGRPPTAPRSNWR